jgi:hypothetical protein
VILYCLVNVYRNFDSESGDRSESQDGLDVCFCSFLPHLLFGHEDEDSIYFYNCSLQILKHEKAYTLYRLLSLLCDDDGGLLVKDL